MNQASSPLKLNSLLGKLESKVMEIVWDKNQATVREVRENLKKRKKIAYTTVMTIMDNLFQKGYLTREKCGKAYCYTPVQPRQEFLENNVSQIVDQLLTEYGPMATVQFLEKLGSIDPKLRQKLLKELKNDE